MMGNTHKFGGITTGILYVNYINPNLFHNSSISVPIVFYTSVLVGSLIPDIDHENSIISKTFSLSSKLISNIFGHRRLFHSPLLYLFLYLFLKPIIPPIIFTGLFIGIFSHIFLDMFTKKGIPLFYPLVKDYYRIIGVKTNGIFEQVLRFSFIVYIIIEFYSKIKK